MVVICPKCKVRLKVSDEKIATEGTRFKCPKCGMVLLVKRSAVRAKTLDEKKILVAHENAATAERIKAVLIGNGFSVVTAADGVEAMVNAARELPFLSILSVSLPRIYGFEVAGRLKKRPETQDMKVMLVASLYDKNRYRREPVSFHGADGYIEEHQIEESLMKSVDSLKEASAPTREPSKNEAIQEKKELKGHDLARDAAGAAGTRPAEPSPQKVPEEAKSAQLNDMIEKAKRLVRTIISDINLYNRAKVEEAIKNSTFHATFASDLKEGMKLYETRIPAEVRRLGDFFGEAVNNFIEKKKRDNL